MTTILLEYVWLDGAGTLRSKTKVHTNFQPQRPQQSHQPQQPQQPQSVPGTSLVIHVSDVPVWSFDGSSTGQAIGTDSDVFIRPVRLYPNPFYSQATTPPAYLVLCECLNRDGTPHQSNARSRCADAERMFSGFEPWFGIEQEYMLFDYDGSQPHGWVTPTDPGLGHSAAYYCGVGGDRVIGRGLMDTHMMHCIKAKVSICGTNLEVTASQLEYQVGPRPPVELADDLIMSRYILLRLSEDFECAVSFEPKPYTQRMGYSGHDGGEEWTGSGGHCNFSDRETRGPDGLQAIHARTERMAANYPALLAACGQDNHLRLTGTNEAPEPTQFTVGEGNRGASVRVPHLVLAEGRGYLEFRAPGANVDPYVLLDAMMRAVYDQVAG